MTEGVEQRAARFSEYARRYSRLGWALVRLDGKVPRERGWEQAKPEAPELAAGKWSRWGERWNIGGALGTSQPPLAVIEDDRDDAHERFLGLFGGELPQTPIVESGGKSLHGYFLDSGQGNASVEGLELRAGAQQCVLPPSEHPETRLEYRWLKGHEPWTVPFLPIPESALSYFAGTLFSTNGPEPIPERIPKGSRHRTLVSIAGTLRRRGLSAEAIMVSLIGVNAQCDPPLDERELAELARDIARRYAPAPPDPEQEQIEQEAERLLTDEGEARSRADVPVAAETKIGSRSFIEHHGRAITFLRPGVPNRNVTTLAGDGGLGKSLLALSWAVDVAGAGGEALIVVAEDGEDVAKMRLRALDAPLERLHFLTVEWGLDERGDPDYDAAAVSLPEQAGRLDEIVASYRGRLRLVIVDPWAECLDVSVDSHQAQSLRRAIAALRRIASRRELAIVVVAHLNKSGQTSLRKRIDGSGALYDGSRSVFLLAPDPDEDAKRVLAHGKFNIGEPLVSREYVIESILVPEENGEPDGSSAKIVDSGWTSTRTVAELLGASKRDEAPRSDEATEFLTFALLDGDWHDSAGLKTLAGAQKISERTLQRAVSDLRIEVERRGFPASTWWRLPVAPPDRGATGDSAQTDSRATRVSRATAWRDCDQQATNEEEE